MNYEKLLSSLLEDNEIDKKDKTSVAAPPVGKVMDGGPTEISNVSGGGEVMSQFSSNVQTAGYEDTPLPDTHTDIISHVHTHELGNGGAERNKLPVKQSTEVSTSGPEKSELEWYKVSKLPMFQNDFVRGAFVPFFRDQLGMDLYNCFVATDLAGSKTEDVRKFAGFLLKNGTFIEEWNELSAFGIPKELYKGGRAVVLDFDGQRYYVMQEEHGSGQVFNYVYYEPDGGSAVNKRIR